LEAADFMADVAVGRAEMDLAEYVRQIDAPIKLHLGCGGERWRDFINVDYYPMDPDKPDSSRSGCVADAFADVRALGLEANVVQEIFTSHTIDHFTRWEATDMLRDWHRMLVPGGKLIIEAADFRRCVLYLFHPSKSKRERARNQFYGNQWDRLDYQTHRYVWSARELAHELRKAGFSKVTWHHRTMTHHPGRDMQVTAVKGVANPARPASNAMPEGER
jgi:predicted SAM-dependent methyltransferase